MEEIELDMFYDESVDFMRKLIKNHIVFEATSNKSAIHFKLQVSPAEKELLGGLL